MYEHPSDKLQLAGHALRDMADEFYSKEHYGLAFVLRQLGDTVYDVGEKIVDEAWAPSLEMDD